MCRVKDGASMEAGSYIQEEGETARPENRAGRKTKRSVRPRHRTGWCPHFSARTPGASDLPLRWPPYSPPAPGAGVAWPGRPRSRSPATTGSVRRLSALTTGSVRMPLDKISTNADVSLLSLAKISTSCEILRTCKKGGWMSDGGEGGWMGGGAAGGFNGGVGG